MAGVKLKNNDMKTKEEYKAFFDFLNNQGYCLEWDEDGFWFEDYVSDHKWKDVFELMESYHREQLSAGIKAKALRKKGTNKWYHADDMQEQVYLKDIPQIWGDTITTKGMIEFATELPLPADAELVEVTIIVEP